MQYFVEGLFSVLQTVIILSMYFPLMNKNAKKKKKTSGSIKAGVLITMPVELDCKTKSFSKDPYSKNSQMSDPTGIL